MIEKQRRKIRVWYCDELSNKGLWLSVSKLSLMAQLGKIIPPRALRTYKHHISVQQSGFLANFPSQKYLLLKLLKLDYALLECYLKQMKYTCI